MADGVVSKWLKQVGDAVARGEPLFEVESDKVTTEVEAPAAGVLRQIKVPEGEKVDVGTVLAVIGGADEAMPGASAGAATASPANTAAATPTAPAATPTAPAAATPTAPAASVSTETATKLFVTPRARMVAGDLGVELAGIKGTGPGGRILERDVLARAPAAPAAAPAPASPPPAAAPVPTPAVPATLLPLAGIRRTIAERMLKSQQTVAEVTITSEVDMAEVVKLRGQIGVEWEKQHGFRPSYTDVIVKAVARALREHPKLNSTLTDQGIQLHSEINVGIGVALDDGLIVPVVRNADQKSLVDVSRAVRDLGERARTNQLTRDDVGGGTFTISNLGTFGVETFTPIINLPECAILGVGRIVERAVVREGQLVARPTMWLSLTFDHRIVDGAPAAQFLGRVRQLLESPYLLFV
jgi:pyruvate dehydrogenase E2 component (dihydrolipoamide acetyltransferase)